MDVKIFPTMEEAATYTVKYFQEALHKGADVFGLATGSTPIPFYRQVTQSDMDFSDKIAINLDEYYGLSNDHPQSYHVYMHQQLFHKKPFKVSYLPNGVALDVEAEIARYNQILQEHPIDVQLLGIGGNGHIGFNEPGAAIDGQTQLVNLAEQTIQANSRFFDRVEDVPTQAFSMGLGSIMQAKKIILLAFGEGKADAIAKTVNGPVTKQVPASILQNHPDVTIVLDEAAAAKL